MLLKMAPMSSSCGNGGEEERVGPHLRGNGIVCAAAVVPVASLLQAVCRTVFQSQRKAFNSKAHRLEGEAAKLAAEAEKKAKRGGAATG